MNAEENPEVIALLNATEAVRVAVENEKLKEEREWKQAERLRKRKEKEAAK